jgi:hypothetical protein
MPCVRKGLRRLCLQPRSGRKLSEVVTTVLRLGALVVMFTLDAAAPAVLLEMWFMAPESSLWCCIPWSWASWPSGQATGETSGTVDLFTSLYSVSVQRPLLRRRHMCAGGASIDHVAMHTDLLHM